MTRDSRGTHGDPVDRRTFLHKSAVGALGAALVSRAASSEAEAKSRLVMVKHGGATDDIGDGHPEIVRAMVDRAIREWTRKDSLADAWREFVSPDDVVGIKLNCRGGRYLSTQPCVVDAVVAGLTAAGVKPNNIIAWDAWTEELPKAGFTVNYSDEGVRYYATEKGTYKPPGRQVDRLKARDALTPHYDAKPVALADQEVQFSKILSEEITALINIPLIKDHMIAGVTCSMKNHYGSILNPNLLHGNNCDPYLAALSALPPIKNKTRLILVDGLRSLYNGGPRDKPQWRWQQNSIIVGTDPATVDAQALRILEAKRAEVGMEPIGEMAKYLESAAALGLGTTDLERTDLVEIDAAVEA